MSDYSKGKIYKIECNITNDVYYGSTRQSLSERLALHKSSRTCTAINIIDRGNYTCKIIEEYPCDSKKELEAQERWWIENNVCINKQVPGRTREENKEYLLQQKKKYREANRDAIITQRKIYYEQNKDKVNEKFTCECGGKYTHQHKSTHCKSKKHQKYILSISED